MELNDEALNNCIEEISLFPKRLEALISNITKEQLHWCYRPDGWTIKQVVHHCADSHMNSLIRFKLALTENNPIIKPYNEAKWANLTDGLDNDISDSVLILKGLHSKWVLLLKSLNKEQLKRRFVHPEHGEEFSVSDTIGNYAWHCNHHLAHIKNALDSNGRFS